MNYYDIQHKYVILRITDECIKYMINTTMQDRINYNLHLHPLEIPLSLN